ncbi:MAG: class I SAM-dependent methyltransferase [Corynebacterium sp.]|nr:class I SAM-dependent methyltransferase [Corynebacterium sp.]
MKPCEPARSLSNTDSYAGSSLALLVDIQKELDAYWTRRARHYDAYQFHSPRTQAERALWAAKLRPIIAALPTRKDQALALDIGTGSGFMATLLAGMGLRTMGIDHAPGMIEIAAGHCKEYADLSISRQDAANLAIVDSTVDLITARFVLWTMRSPLDVVREWHRVLKTGGVAVCIDAPWFPDGEGVDISAPGNEGPERFSATYTAEVMSQLPLSRVRDVAPYEQVFLEAGFRDVSVYAVPEVADLDAQFGTAPGHISRPHFIVIGRK